MLKYLFYGFEIRHWYKNVENSIRKTPKWFLRDWALVIEPGKRFETMVACHLLKAVDGWIDLRLGEFELFYIRDKQKREVDFMVTRDHEQWMLVEAKQGERRLSVLAGSLERKALTRTHPMPRQCWYEAAIRISRGKSSRGG